MPLHTNLRLISNPFSKKSSEEEIDIISNIFFEPNYYPDLLSRLTNSESTLIIGQRGHGKTSIINKLFDDISVDENVLVIKIDRFESIPLKDNEIAFLQLIITQITTYSVAFLIKNKRKIKTLTRNDKEKLAFFVKYFFHTLSEKEFEDVYERVQTIKTKNLFKKIYNKYIASFINIAANSLIDFSATAVSKHLGINSLDTSQLSKEFFPNFKVKTGIPSSLNETQCTVESLKEILDNILLLNQKINLQKTIILFDKVDEYRNLQQDLNKISLFIKDVLSDTELFLNNNLSIGFSLWSELKTKLAGIVRFDKFGHVDVRWRDQDLEPLINKRISHFSINNNVLLSDLIPHKEDINETIKLSNKSPRDLIILLNLIFLEQSNEDPDVSYFKDKPIRNGMIKFCSTYDYESIFTRKSGKGREVKSMINRLLQLKLHRFTRADLNSHFNQSDNQSRGQIKLMIDYCLIREETILALNGAKSYEILDYKILFLIKHLVTRIE